MNLSSLTASILQAYPFSFVVAHDDTLCALGSFFNRQLPDVLHRPVEDCFKVAKSKTEVRLRDLIDFIRRDAKSSGRVELLFTAPSPEDGTRGGSPEPPAIRLAGSLLPGDIPETCLFIGTLAPSDVKNMTAYDLTIGDFGPIDPTPEFAMMAEVNASMLADSQVMNGQLRASRDQALAAKHELELHREHLEDLVKQRTETIELQATELEEALLQEKRLSEMQRNFVSMTSHEFRTPLAIIDGSARRIQKRFDRMSSDDMTMRIRKIRFAVKRMTALMESTLAAARMEAGKIQVIPGRFDIKALFSECCEIQQELSADHQIDLLTEDLPDHMQSDAACVTQIVTNLLSNAVKYSPGADRVEVRSWRDGDGLAISVRDYGLGIDDDDQEQMFTRFFRAKTSIGIPGTGIGLNLAYMLAAELGGSLSLRSKKGEGSTFTLWLPLSAENAEALAKIA